MLRSCAAFVSLLALCSGARAECPEPGSETGASWTGEKQWLAIERAGLRFGKIEVEVTNVFDADQPGQDAPRNVVPGSAGTLVIFELPPADQSEIPRAGHE